MAVLSEVSAGAGYLIPDAERARPEQPVVHSPEQVAANTEQIAVSVIAAGRAPPASSASSASSIENTRVSRLVAIWTFPQQPRASLISVIEDFHVGDVLKTDLGHSSHAKLHRSRDDGGDSHRCRGF